MSWPHLIVKISGSSGTCRGPSGTSCQAAPSPLPGVWLMANFLPVTTLWLSPLYQLMDRFLSLPHCQLVIRTGWLHYQGEQMCDGSTNQTCTLRVRSWSGLSPLIRNLIRPLIRTEWVHKQGLRANVCWLLKGSTRLTTKSVLLASQTCTPYQQSFQMMCVCPICTAV